MKYVPIEKRSKKAQKAYHAARRGSWNGVRPVTKTVESKKIYDRKRMKRGFDPDASSVFCFIFAQSKIRRSIRLRCTRQPSSSRSFSFRQSPPA